MSVPHAVLAGGWIPFTVVLVVCNYLFIDTAQIFSH